MDPNACVLRIVGALPGNVDEFIEACTDLATWIARGGFAPSNLDRITDEHLLMLRMHGQTTIEKILRDARAKAAEPKKEKREW